jgi:hypothetical protein
MSHEYSVEAPQCDLLLGRLDLFNLSREGMFHRGCRRGRRSLRYHQSPRAARVVVDAFDAPFCDPVELRKDTARNGAVPQILERLARTFDIPSRVSLIVRVQTDAICPRQE